MDIANSEVEKTVEIAAEMLDAYLPSMNFGFVLIVAPVERAEGKILYRANIERESVIELMRTFIPQLRAERLKS